MFNFLRKKRLPKKEDYPPIYSKINLSNLYVTQLYSDDLNTYVKKGYGGNHVVYTICDKVSKAASNARWKVIDKRTNEEAQVPLLNIESGSQLPILERPIGDKTWSNVIKDFCNQYLLFGNLFICAEYGKGINENKVTSFYHLPAQNVQIYTADNFRKISHYAVNINFSNYRDTKIPADQVTHIKMPNPDTDSGSNALYGQSPFKPVLESIQTVNESIDMGNWLLQNKGAAKMVGPEYDGVEISDLQQQQLRENLKQVAQGTKNVGSIPIASIPMKTVDLSSNARDLLMLDQRVKAETEICNAIGVPAQLIGHNIRGMYDEKEAKKLMWESCVIPFLDELTEALNISIVRSYGAHLKLEYSVEHIPALQEMKLLFGKAVKELAGLITINEGREWIGLKPIEGGDKILQTTAPSTRTPNLDRPEGYDDEYNETRRNMNLY